MVFFSSQELNSIHTRIALFFLDGLSFDDTLDGLDERLARGVIVRMLFESGMRSDRSEELLKLLVDIELARRVSQNKDKILTDFVNAMKKKKPNS